MTGKISPRGFETGQKTRAILENSRLNDSSSEASPPEQGVRENEGYGWVLADESSQLAAIWGIPSNGVPVF
jgi:hypothetical protein